MTREAEPANTGVAGRAGATQSSTATAASQYRGRRNRASCAVHCTLPLGGTSYFPFCRFEPASLLDGHAVFESSFAEALEIELLDELWQWQLPRFLLVVIDLAQFRRVQPKLSGHLYLAVRQVVASSRIDPRLHFLIRLFDFLRHTLWHSLV